MMEPPLRKRTAAEQAAQESKANQGSTDLSGNRSAEYADSARVDLRNLRNLRMKISVNPGEPESKGDQKCVS
jgi:hypothetical protein